ncbi:Eukaryotic translation initiation factor 4 gamma [Nesidiocoris tenuis]|uniref:Eukaryotic translation initiation factor 4 gamma 2 n=1 Tax=Nesidiocoris tenuis TaxID=355587 RepID=A0ABN7B465_9HEMI|nr:Eukaryotic translation initiation factor 4 gamma [Nesidiocoris tenuis]
MKRWVAVVIRSRLLSNAVASQLLLSSRSTTEGPTGAGGASPVNGGRDENRTRRWVPPSIVRRHALTAEEKTDVIFRRVRGILNKLTPEKFDKLSDDLVKEELNTDVILKGVIFLVFEKALDEPKYSAMYAQLCRRLCEEIRNPDELEPCRFCHMLLSSCKVMFDNRSKLRNNKRKSLGNIKFIGELCKLGILKQSILYDCLIQLLQKNKSKTSEGMAEDLECVCQILRTCGHILDTNAAEGIMNQLFDRMALLTKNPSLPIRIRFMLLDIIELRRAKWVPRKVSYTEGPLPINQLSDDSGSTPRNNNTERLPQQELFPKPLKTRAGLDNILSGSLSFTQHDKFPYNSNGFQSSFNSLPPPNTRERGAPRQNFHHMPQNNSHFYPQNRYNNNQHNNNNANNVSNNKDLAPRFIKRIMTNHDNSGNIELRPPANSMLFKPPNTKPIPSSLFPGRTDTLAQSLKPQNPPPIQTTKEVPILIKQASNDRGKPNKKEKAATKEETLKKVCSIAEEVMTGANIDEAAANFSQLKIQDRLVAECVSSAVATSFTKTDEERENLRAFVATLFKAGSMTSSQFSDVFRSIVKTAADMDSTNPLVFHFVAEMASTAIKENFLSIAQVGDLTEDGINYPLLYLTLSELHKAIGKERLSELFNQSKVSLMNALSDRERTKTRLNEVLEERQLVFLEPLLVLERELWSALEREPTAQSLYRCAKESISSEHHTSPAFITALMTVTLRYITQEANAGKSITETAQDAKLLQEKEKALLERFKSVLQAFLHEDINLQVTAVYALQVFCFAVDFPKGMLLRWFVNLYDLEIVEEEAFLKWREDVTDVYPGKGKALFQVNQWLTWLAEAESEEEEEDDGEN